MSITTGLSGSIVQAFSWMLIHSLWQGLLFSFLAGIILMLTRKAGAAIRYNLLLALFAAFMFTVTATFFYEWNHARTQIAQDQMALNLEGNTYKVSALSYSPIIRTTNTHPDLFSSYNIKDIINKFSNYFSANSFMIVMLWFIFFMAKSVSLAGNMLYMHRARHYRVYAPADHWKETVASLCEKLQLKRAVLLLESGYIKVPVVIGYFKPVILVPVGLIAGIPAAQVEAVLLHELAHIRRSDYAVNFMQSIAEAIFFFNPGLLWISSLLKEERESCCDDMAIAQTNNKEAFVQALISFREYSVSTPVHAVAFSGQKSTLLNRVMRIVYQENKTLSLKENGIFIIGIAMLVLTAFTVYPVKETKSVKPHTSISKNNSSNFDQSLKKPMNAANMALPESGVNNSTVAGAPADTIGLAKGPVADKIADNQAMPTPQIQAADKFDDSKFYSRTVLEDGEDLIKFRLKGTGGSATLPHNGKVAFIINGVIHEESEMANYTESQISTFDTGASSIGSTLNAKERFPDLDLSKYEAYIAIGLDYTEAMKWMGNLPKPTQAAVNKTPPQKEDTISANEDMLKMSRTPMKDLVASLKFDDSKFYSRIVVDGGNYDMIRFRVTGKGMGMIELPHNARVALIINGVIHDESEINNFTESQISAFDTGRFRISRTINAKEDFPDLDLSKYGAYIAIGSYIGNINTNYQPTLNKGDGLNVKSNSTLDVLLKNLMPEIKINADGTVSNGNKTITDFNINGKHYTVAEIKAAIRITKPDSSTNSKRGGGGGFGGGIRYGP